MRILAKIIGSTNKVQFLPQFSMHSLLSVSHGFPSAGEHPYADAYRLFRCEPMHDFSSLLSPLLIEYISGMLKHDANATVRMVTKTWEKRKFMSAGKQIPWPANAFRTLFERSTSGYSVSTNFSEGERSVKIDSLFSDTELIGFP